MPPTGSTAKAPTLPAAQPRTKAEKRRLPRHVAIILDGNGRWATNKGLPRPAGHVKGVEAVREVVVAALNHGVEVLSLYAFSVLNWRRPEEEVEGLMRIFRHYLAVEAPRLAEEGVRLRLLGDRARLPEDVRTNLDEAERRPAGNARLALNLAVNYGGREDLIQAMQGLARAAAAGELAPETIDAPRLEGQLYTRDLPPVDLLIRTAGERRLSNFLLWQSAYAELLFLDVLWPDFTAGHFGLALADYAQRRRTFGGLVDRGTPEGHATVV